MKKPAGPNGPAGLSLYVIPLEIKEILGVIVANVAHHTFYSFHFFHRKFAILHVVAEQVAKRAAEIFVARIGQEGTAVGEHSHKTA